jgi:type III restriction enzyme
MGAFITYLYTQHNIKNFFVVAPGTTIYEKLKDDLSRIGTKKYVFTGLDCFAVNPPNVITGEDYKNKRIAFTDSDVNIYVYNIGKFNSEGTKMRSFNEVLGEAFFDKLSKLDDLVLIMDESHHYRAKAGAKALNDLKPILGLELTATPLFARGQKQVKFKNVVYEYPLSQAIEDGYTRTPTVLTRKDVSAYNFGDEELDKMMLNDGVRHHELMKTKLKEYAANNQVQVIKPFMLVVCKDTSHADAVEKYIKSEEFKNGFYKYKTITVHTNQNGTIKDENMRLLLSVELPDNPIEIVIHVDKLKEGWDVNNLYTIVPLRTATSKILREQMVGRGLRLPYGRRTGDEAVDSVVLTAHDKFDDIIKEACRGDSIFNAGNVIIVEDEPECSKSVQPQINFGNDFYEQNDDIYKALGVKKSQDNDDLIKISLRELKKNVEREIQESSKPDEPLTKEQVDSVIKKTGESIKAKEDYAEVFDRNKNGLINLFEKQAPIYHVKAIDKFIPIPIIKITEDGIEEYEFVDFELDLANLNQVPIDNDLVYQSLLNSRDRKIIKGDAIDFDAFDPRAILAKDIREKPEINYNKCGDLLNKLILSAIKHYEDKYGENGMKNIIMMNKLDISRSIYNQMMNHFYYKQGLFLEEVIGVEKKNIKPEYSYEVETDLFSNDFTCNIKQVLFTGIEKGVFNCAKFDSREGELTFARIIDRDPAVINWLRPTPNQFKITYNRGKRYEPDFVVETDQIIYLVEVKGEDKLKDPDVIAKKERGVKYCEAATNWGLANGYKEWRYLFIPSKETTMSNASFSVLAEKFKEL